VKVSTTGALDFTYRRARPVNLFLRPTLRSGHGRDEVNQGSLSARSRGSGAILANRDDTVGLASSCGRSAWRMA